MYKPIAPYLLILAVIASLLNTHLFGGFTLTAYFFYCIIAATCGIFFLVPGIYTNTKVRLRVPDHFIFFLLFVSYVFVHGLISGNINLVHYYWAVSIVFLFTIFFWLNAGNAGSTYLSKGIVFVAFIESLVVVLQFLKLAPVPGSLFRCTGTWINPNVTAIFLAMALYTVLKPGLFKNRLIFFVILAAVLVALLLLQCRTAIIVALLFIAGRYGPRVIVFGRQKLGINKKLSIAVLSFIGAAFLLLIAFRVKAPSTDGRMQVWKNSLGLVAEKPLLGHGFGLFERDYNLFVANRQLPSRDHIAMPYNDFIELGVEGGLPAVILWAAFLVATLRFCIRNNYPFLPLIAFALVQLVNFGFQAIPAFVLFLIYVATDMSGAGKPAGQKAKTKPARSFLTAIYYFIPVIALFLVLQQINLAKAFYRKGEIATTMTAWDAIDAYSALGEQLNGYQRYHESYGDAWLQLRRYDPALSQYLAATKSCSEPGIFSKCAWCYQMEKKYDSSRYYYTLVQNMQPGMVGPRMALLNLYRGQGDSALVRLKAKEIANMQVRVKNAGADTMQMMAKKLLEEK